MNQVGTIKELWRYPVKGMAGEQIAACALTQRGLEGDRVFALRDVARAEIQSCKVRPQLLLCRARTSEGESGIAEIEFPDGQMLRSDDARVPGWLTALTGHASTLEPLREATDRAFYRRFKQDERTWLREIEATFEREPGEPIPDLTQLPEHLVDSVSIPGTFFLVSPLHLLSTATLAHLARRNIEADWDVRRFRPNIVVDANAHEGLVEQEWIGRRLTIGEVVIDCMGATPRCGAVTRAQPGFHADKTILRSVVRDAAQNAGVYAVIRRAGMVKVGDPVLLE